MIPIGFLAVGSLLLSLSVAYWLWGPIRRYRLGIDLLEQVVLLDGYAKRQEATGDAAYLHTREAIINFSENTEMFAWAAFAYLTVIEAGERKTPKTENVALANEIDRIQNFVGARISDYLLYETASGIGLRCMAFVLPRKQTITKVRAVVGRLIEPINESCLDSGRAVRC